MLMEFVIIVIGSALGFVLGAGLLFALIMNQKVLDWHMNKTKKMVQKSFESMDF